MTSWHLGEEGLWHKYLMHSKFQQSGVPTRDSSFRRIPKLCNLSLVKAELLNWWIDVELLDIESNIQSSIHLKCWYSTRGWFKYLTTIRPTIWPRITIFFWIARRDQVICWSLMHRSVTEEGRGQKIKICLTSFTDNPLVSICAPILLTFLPYKHCEELNLLSE